MQRCLELAKLGAGYVAPNPMVGAVLVFEDRIIGEGWHQHYGQAHAEVNCLGSVKEEERRFIEHSILYVSLEPCAHFGKTPPCTDLIIKNNISRVVIGCLDPFKKVNGRGVDQLRAAGIKVELADGQIKTDCEQINKRFFVSQKAERPYIILKWAQTNDQKIAPSLAGKESRLMISNEYTNRMVHKWRSEEAAILVGTSTALLDDPALTTRLWIGPSPTRLVLDLDLRLPQTLNVFNGESPTIVFNGTRHTVPDTMTADEIKKLGGNWYFKISKTANSLDKMLKAFYSLKIQSVLVEGGAKLLQSFIDGGTWDEMRVITNKELTISDGLPAPKLVNSILSTSEPFFSDVIETYFPLRGNY